MTLFLRTKENRTVVDIELSTKEGVVDIHCAIDLRQYSNLLWRCATDQDGTQALINCFTELSEIRGWLWERYEYEEDTDKDDFPAVLALVRKKLDIVGEKYGLHRVED